MKKLLASLAAAVLVGGFAGSATAIQVQFDAVGSSIDIVDSSGMDNLTGAVVLNGNTYDVVEGIPLIVDFFTLSADGIAVGATYEIEAVLAFALPADIGDASGTGTGTGFTFFNGQVLGNTLTWDYNQNTFVSGGSLLQVTFEEGMIAWGDPTTIHATIANLGAAALGGAAAPVPEPATLLLLGAGLLGFGLTRGRRRNG